MSSSCGARRTTNGATWSDPSIVGPVATPEASWINNHGDAIYIKSKPLVLWNGHDAAYGTYQNFRRIGTPAP